jgi:hypothetical protein
MFLHLLRSLAKETDIQLVSQLKKMISRNCEVTFFKTLTSFVDAIQDRTRIFANGFLIQQRRKN